MKSLYKIDTIEEIPCYNLKEFKPTDSTPLNVFENDYYSEWKPAVKIALLLETVNLPNRVQFYDNILKKIIMQIKRVNQPQYLIVRDSCRRLMRIKWNYG